MAEINMERIISVTVAAVIITIIIDAIRRILTETFGLTAAGNESVILLPSGARTASGSTGDIDVGRFLYGEICVDVTAVSGTSPVLNVYVEGKNRYTGKYKTLLSFENISSVQTLWGTITMLAFTLVRVRWTISGTSPSFTFSVSGEFKS